MFELRWLVVKNSQEKILQYRTKSDIATSISAYPFKEVYTPVWGKWQDVPTYEIPKEVTQNEHSN